MKLRKLVAHSIFNFGALLGAGQVVFGAGAPNFQVDSSWPGQLPNKWTIGQVSGLAVTGQGHILLIHRPGTIGVDQKMAAANPPGAECCVPAPPVIE